jgi:DNA polymerase-3 subunit delta
MQLLGTDLTKLPLDSPVYLIHGGEPLQTYEAITAIRNKLQEQGCTERKTLAPNNNFNWEQLLETSQNLSLFSTKQLLELSIKEGKLGLNGGKMLTQFIASQPADICLLIIADKLDNAVQKTKWFTAIQQMGCIIVAKPIAEEQFPRWISTRLKLAGFTVNAEVIALLARLYCGNLLALAQLIEKLALCYVPGALSLEQIIPQLQNNADYNVFNLIDAAISRDSKKICQIFACLKNDKVEPILVLWGIARELRTLIKVSFAMQANQPFSEICRKHGIWPARASKIRDYLATIKIGQLTTILQKLTNIDLTIKGAQAGLVWESLLTAYLQFANTNHPELTEKLTIC